MNICLAGYTSRCPFQHDLANWPSDAYREVEEGVYDALKDPKKTLVTPPREEIPPYLNFAPIEQASDDLRVAAPAYDKIFDAAAAPFPR
jgi:hypothetical protein